MSTSTLTCTASAAPTSYAGKIHLEPAFDLTMIGRFAFARVKKGDVCLVQLQQRSGDGSPPLSSPSSPSSSSSSPVDVKVFRHEFISIFRYSHCDTVHPSDIRILEPIDDELTHYEEDTGTLFLAKDLTERLRNMTDRRGSVRPHMAMMSLGQRRQAYSRR